MGLALSRRPPELQARGEEKGCSFGSRRGGLLAIYLSFALGGTFTCRDWTGGGSGEAGQRWFSRRKGGPV